MQHGHRDNIQDAGVMALLPYFKAKRVAGASLSSRSRLKTIVFER
jgi:hypothetical protein